MPLDSVASSVFVGTNERPSSGPKIWRSPKGEIRQTMKLAPETVVGFQPVPGAPYSYAVACVTKPPPTYTHRRDPVHRGSDDCRLDHGSFKISLRGGASL